MTSGKYILAVIVASFLLVGFLFIASPTTAATQLPAILASAATAVTLLAKMGETEAKVDQTTTISQQNAKKLVAVASQVDTNTETTDKTHEIVNSQRTQMMHLIEQLQKDIELLRLEKATTRTAQGHADDTEARIISAIGARGAQAPDQLADGTLVVTAPALIAVVAPETGAEPTP